MYEPLTVTIELERINCPTCGLTYAVPKAWMDDQRRMFRERGENPARYCPSGHAMVFAGKSQAAELEATFKAKLAAINPGTREMFDNAAKVRKFEGRAKGGIARAAKLTEAERTGIARKAALVRWHPKMPGFAEEAERQATLLRGTQGEEDAMDFAEAAMKDQEGKDEQ